MRVRWFLEPATREVDSYVVVEDDEDVHTHRYDTVELKIADCDRNVRLYFPTGNARNRSASRRKIAKLRKALDLVAERVEL